MKVNFVRCLLLVVLFCLNALPSQAQYYPSNPIPRDHCIIVIASRPSLAEAVGYIRNHSFINSAFPSRQPYRHNIMVNNTRTFTDVGLSIYKSSNGWYAIAIGSTPKTYSDLSIRNWRKHKHFPSDSFCSSGKKFTAEFTHTGKPVGTSQAARPQQSHVDRERNLRVVQQPRRVPEKVQTLNWGDYLPSREWFSLFEREKDRSLLGQLMSVLGTLFWLFILLHYMPTLICMVRGGKSWFLVFIANTFFGWTGVGWIVLFVYSLV